MPEYYDVVLRSDSLERLLSLGDVLEISPRNCDSATLLTALGDTVVTTRLTAEQIDKLPGIPPPVVLCDWRGDEVDEEGVLLPWPDYSMMREELDEEGNPTGNMIEYRQGAGRIAR